MSSPTAGNFERPKQNVSLNKHIKVDVSVKYDLSKENSSLIRELAQEINKISINIRIWQQWRNHKLLLLKHKS